jgi:hypothetical protein
MMLLFLEGLQGISMGAKTREALVLLLILITCEAVTGLISGADVFKNLVQDWVHLSLFVLLLGLAAFRVGRAISYNYIFSWLRAPFVDKHPDSSGAGDSEDPKGEGVTRVIGELLCCPICTGTWAAIVMASMYAVMPVWGMVFIVVMAASAIAEYLHWKSEADEWRGRAAREVAGTHSTRKSFEYALKVSGAISEAVKQSEKRLMEALAEKTDEGWILK